MVFVGIDVNSQDIIVGTDKGVIRATEFRHKGSEQERWNLEEVNKPPGLPW